MVAIKVIFLGQTLDIVDVKIITDFDDEGKPEFWGNQENLKPDLMLKPF